MEKIIHLALGSIILLCLFSCDNSNQGNGNPDQNPIVNPAVKDTCCALSYPAKQIGVSGGDLLDNFTRLASPLNSPYKIEFTPLPAYTNISQAYIDYVKALYPCATGLGTKIIISQGSLGGHTQRRMVQPRYITFTPLSPPGYTINASDVWVKYYENPTPLPTTTLYGPSYGLQPNVIYGIEYGVWIDGCNLTQKESDCLGYFNYQKFRWQSPQNLVAGENYVILEILDEEDKVIESRKVKIEEEK